MTMSVRLPVMAPFASKKSMRTVCDPEEVFPIMMSVDQPFPAATCANTREPLPPIEGVVTAAAVSVGDVGFVGAVTIIGTTGVTEPGLTGVFVGAKVKA